jgi:hypothetical protein
VPKQLTADNYRAIPAELRLAPLWIQYDLKKDEKHPEKKPSKRPVMKWGTQADRAANLRPLDYLLGKL